MSKRRKLSPDEVGNIGLEHGGSRVIQRMDGHEAPAGEPGGPGHDPYQLAPDGSDPRQPKGPMNAKPPGTWVDALNSGANAAALHAGPQIAGAMGAVANSFVDGIGINDDSLEAYRFVRDETGKELAKSGDTQLGEVGSSIGQFLTPGPRVPASATSGALTAGAMGAISGAAQSKGDLTKTDDWLKNAGEVGLDALFGFGASAPGGAAMGGLMGAAESPLRSGARELALDTLGVKGPAKARMAERGIKDSAADDVLAQMKPFRDGMRRGTLEPAVERELQDRGKAIGEIILGVDTATGDTTVQPLVHQQAMTDRAVELSRRSNLDRKRVAGIIGDEANQFLESHGDRPMSLQAAEEYKRLFGPSVARQAKARNETRVPGKTDAEAEIYRIVNQANEDAAEAAAGSLAPHLKGKFKPAKQAYERLAAALEGTGTAKGGLRDSDFDWGDALNQPDTPLIEKLASQGVPKWLSGVPIAAGNMLGRAYGRGVGAKGLESLANQAASQTGGVSGGAISRDLAELGADEAGVDPLSPWSRFLRGPQ